MAIPIGIQLYTIREDCGKDFRASLKRIADIGYKGVETAGLYNQDPKELGKYIADLGMTVCGSHVGMPKNEKEADLLSIESNGLNTKMLVSGFGPNQFESKESFQSCISELQIAIKMLADKGLKLSYHNHWWEFVNIGSQLAFDMLYREVPELLAEVDVYWAQVGKRDPALLIKNLKNRTPLLHIKDGNIEPKEPHTSVGSGKLNIPNIVKAAEANNTEWLIVELDSCATDMFEAVQNSYDYLIGNGLAIGNK